ncbi:MAG: type II toxin-antitoxin system Phd/YefM family antitoxin [Gammaproteobacteria bacterium]
MILKRNIGGVFMLIERSEQVVNSTDLSRKTKGLLDELSHGGKDKMVVMRDNKPAAVLLSIKEYEAQLDELEDLRMEAIAAARLSGFDRAQAVSHDEIIAEFGAAGG